MHDPVGATPFTVAVPDAVLQDLRDRLSRARFPAVEPAGPPWHYGTDLRYLRELVDYPPDAPITTRDMSGIFNRLITDVLGCERFVAQGGDWGSMITSWLALDHPERLAAVHLNMT